MKNITTIATVLLYLVLTKGARAQGNWCDSQEDAFTGCFLQNIDTCALACADEFEDIDTGSTMDPNVICELTRNTICPLIRCCGECATEYEDYLDCIELQLEEDNGIVCDLSCDDEDTSNSGGGTIIEGDDTTDGDTISEEETEIDCDAQEAAYDECLEQNFLSCSMSCMKELADSESSTLKLETFDDFCEISRATICPFVRCCPQCSNKSQDYLDCIELQLEQDGISCDLTCTGTVGGGGGDDAVLGSILSRTAAVAVGLFTGMLFW